MGNWFWFINVLTQNKSLRLHFIANSFNSINPSAAYERTYIQIINSQSTTYERILIEKIILNKNHQYPRNDQNTCIEIFNKLTFTHLVSYKKIEQSLEVRNVNVDKLSTFL